MSRPAPIHIYHRSTPLHLYAKVYVNGHTCLKAVDAYTYEPYATLTTNLHPSDAPPRAPKVVTIKLHDQPWLLPALLINKIIKLTHAGTIPSGYVQDYAIECSLIEPYLLLQAQENLKTLTGAKPK